MLNDYSIFELVDMVNDLVEDGEMRICSHCGTIMVRGYCINNGEEYYCSDECLESNMTREDFNELYDEGNGDSYYTDWEYNENNYQKIKYILSKYKNVDYKLQEI